MANQGNRKSSNNSSRSRSTTTNNKSRSTANTRSNKAQPVPESSTFVDYWHYFRKTRLFKPVMTILVITVAVLLNLLLSWNNYTRFFIITGIELIIVAIFSIFKLGLKITIDAAEEDNSGS